MAISPDWTPCDVGGACWHPDGWDSAAEESVQPREGRSRGQAAARFACDVGDPITAVRVWARHVRFWTVQEQWDWTAEGSGCTDDDGNPTDQDGNRIPAEPPPGWYGEEDCPAWEFVHASTPGAVAVWVCGMRGDRPPYAVPAPVAGGHDDTKPASHPEALTPDAEPSGRQPSSPLPNHDLSTRDV